MTDSDLRICDANLSRAWCRAMLAANARPKDEAEALTVSVTGFDDQGMPHEDPVIRDELDALLEKHRKNVVHTVALTIFPQDVWRLSDGDRKIFFEQAQRLTARLEKLDQRNRCGLYFGRLMNFGGGNCGGNQLEHIINTYRHGRQRLQLQASIYDPARDQNGGAIRGFPCLQQVAFAPQGQHLIMNAFYPSQVLLEKAYGNYLGLCHLGAFMAQQMNLYFSRLNIMVGTAKLIGDKKSISKGMLKHSRLFSEIERCAFSEISADQSAA